MQLRPPLLLFFAGMALPVAAASAQCAITYKYDARRRLGRSRTGRAPRPIMRTTAPTIAPTSSSRSSLRHRGKRKRPRTSSQSGPRIGKRIVGDRRLTLVLVRHQTRLHAIAR